MKHYNLLLIVFISNLLPCMLYAGTAYYVDCSCGSNGDGTGSECGSGAGYAWNNIASVNGHSFSTGDDVYFKVGTTCDPSAALAIDWDGSSGDQAIIGAYYGNGEFGLNGNARPIIDGNSTVPGNTNGLVKYQDGTGYVTIKDLHVRNSAGAGISVGYNYEPERPHTDYNTVENCYTQNTTYQGILVGRGSYNTVEDNIVERSSYGRVGGAGIEVTGMSNETVSLYNTVRRNHVYFTWEGIGVYKGARYTTVEYNVVHDTRSYHIYIANARNATVRYNLVYEGDDDEDSSGDKLITTDCEGQAHVPGTVIKVTGYVEIYGNLVAGGSHGISIMNNCEEYEEVEQSGNRVYNNTIVDCYRNFFFKNSDAAFSDNLIKNNISLIITGGLEHSNNYSPTGVTWSHNLFDEAVTGNAATNAVIGDPALSKTSGWRSLSAGIVDGSEFSLTAISDAIDAGVSIAGYNDRITNADYTANPVSVTTTLDSIPDIGAWKYNNGDTTPPAKPTGLIVVE